MNFITDNYVWFIVGGIVLVMALIGYIAEKTDFGRKGKTKKVEPIIEKPVVLSTPIVEATEEVPFEQPIMMGQPFVPTTPTLTEESVMPVVEAEMVVEEAVKPELETEESLISEASEEPVAADESLVVTEPKEEITEVSEVVSEEPTNLDLHNDMKDIDIPLPAIDELKVNDEEAAAEDNDVWKF